MAKVATMPGTKAFDERRYRCTCCGREYRSPMGNFYKAEYSLGNTANEHYSPICIDCINRIYSDTYRQLGSDRLACIMVCYLLDVPFMQLVFDSAVDAESGFKLDSYMRLICYKKYANKNFSYSILNNELNADNQDLHEEQEKQWTETELKNKVTVVEILGYDPFPGYDNESRRYLFNEMVKYLDDDSLEDPYKLSQIVQLVNNNNQIRQYDQLLNRLSPTQSTDIDRIKDLTDMKNKLVVNNDKIAKENAISAKNRKSQGGGKNTLTGLMVTLRDKGFSRIEANYYDQLQSKGTQWAIDMSMRAIRENTFFDENDAKEVFETQRTMIQDQQSQLNELMEKNRLLLLENDELRRKLEDPGDADG